MDQNTSQTNSTQADTSTPQPAPAQVVPAQTGVVQPEQTPPVIPDTPPPTEQPAPEAPQNNYVHTVGESLIDLLTDISTSDVRKQKLAEVMKISIEDVTGILDELLDKIDGELITEAELALIMTSPVTEEVNGQKQSA